ncbi:hypothetical protein SAMN05421805_112116 [Saccharopolyspora antimicrobica]|uniref:Uncharacterized protein n=1 Tax=Saccharopolyspora antimicrobica TaxID=455193 RepID=A0A1I5G7G1_9PSEU|nr:hypothetical protein [Saccharopolyspora antimicrobica]RKT83909.1 hypothetical protein ATL45_2204 [Saccharopolyspora antimicrobica]SFO31431.1 hypothetical protein SAMN05421805_112116 [Saccharopolyspora antimicrobica]
MAVPDQDGSGGTGWATDGDQLKADPGSLRGYGENVATIAGNLQDDAMGGAMNINGVGDDRSISTGGFPEGSHAAQLVDRNARELMSFLTDIRQNHLALSSVAHICADLYEDTDNGSRVRLSGVEWAFAEPGAERPPGAPPYLDGDKTLSDLAPPPGMGKPGEEKLVAKNNFSGGVAYTYETADGRTRTVVQTAEGVTETGYDKNGTETYTNITRPDGTAITKGYDGNGKVISTTTRTTRNRTIAGGSDEVTSIRTEQRGKRPEEFAEHKVTRKYRDGTESHHYYREKLNEKGRPVGERTDDHYVGRQPKKTEPEDLTEHARRNLEKNRRLAEGM